MIIRGWNCSTTLVNHIYKENTNPQCILMGGMRPLPSDFGPLSATSERDYDKDGLLDVEEIDFEASNDNIGEKLIKIDGNGNVELPTFDLCVALLGKDTFYVLKGLERIEESPDYDLSKLYESKIFPILSDPINPDGDGDGILDKVETDNHLDPLAITAIQIEDKLIDDSHCLDEQFISFAGQKNIDGCVITGYIDKGEYNDNTAPISKNVLEFKRSNNAISEYVIKPERNSDYEITAEGGADITIEEENILGRFKALSEENIVESANGKIKVILESNKTYKVTVTSAYQKDYTVKFSQDNWKYAPNGGVRTRTKLPNYSKSEKCVYLTTEDIINIIEAMYPEYGEFKIEDKWDLLLIEKVLDLDVSYTDVLRSELGTRATIVGGIFAFFNGDIFIAIGQCMAIVGNGMLIDGDVQEFKIESFDMNLEVVLYPTNYSDFAKKTHVDEIFISDYYEYKIWDNRQYINKYTDLGVELIVRADELDLNVSAIDKGKYCGWIK